MGTAMAQQSARETFKEREQRVADGRYYKVTEGVYDMSPRFSWRMLRQWYPRTSHYEPAGQPVELRLIELAQAVDNAKSDEQRAPLIEAFKFLAHQHLPNSDVMRTAHDLTYKDSRLGNSEFYHWALWSYIQFVVTTNSGRSFESAIPIMSMGEEIMLVRAVGHNYIDFEGTHSVNGQTYHIHRLQEPDTGRIYRYYVNATMPLLHIKERNAQREETEDRPSILNLR